MVDMKYTFKILLLTNPSKQHSLWDKHPFLAGSRGKNYLELLNGQGVPFDCQSINTLRPEDLLSDNIIRYSAIIFAAPVHKLPPNLTAFLTDYSFQHGVSLIADSFLFKNDRLFFPAFGLQKCSGFRLGGQQITDRAGRLLYRTRGYPYSAQGKKLGLRPLLRMLMQSWLTKKVVFDHRVDQVADFADGSAAISSFPFGRARNYVLNLAPSMILASGNLIHRMIKEILTSNGPATPVFIDLDNSICLRLDDPGSCERVHLKGFNPGVVSGDDWHKLVYSMKQNKLHLNIAYVPQWVDDGDTERGTLIYQGKTIRHRRPGHHYSSKDIIYHRRGNRIPSHDYVSEFKEIKAGVEQGVFSIAAHGLTHLSTDIKAWQQADDRYTNKKWYREFREMVGGKQPDLEKMQTRLQKNKRLLQNAFGQEPDIIVPSAHAQTPQLIEAASRTGFTSISSRATYLLQPDHNIVNRKLFAFYREEMETARNLNRAGYPLIFVCHDYDLFHHGVDWLLEQVDIFRQWGVKHFLPMTDLTCLLLADIAAVTNSAGITVRISFKQRQQSFNKNFTVPLKINGKVSSITINGRPFAGQLSFREGYTHISIPAKEIKQSAVAIYITKSG